MPHALPPSRTYRSECPRPQRREREAPIEGDGARRSVSSPSAYVTKKGTVKGKEGLLGKRLSATHSVRVAPGAMCSGKCDVAMSAFLFLELEVSLSRLFTVFRQLVKERTPAPVGGKSQCFFSLLSFRPSPAHVVLGKRNNGSRDTNVLADQQRTRQMGNLQAGSEVEKAPVPLYPSVSTRLQHACASSRTRGEKDTNQQRCARFDAMHQRLHRNNRHGKAPGAIMAPNHRPGRPLSEQPLHEVHGRIGPVRGLCIRRGALGCLSNRA